MGEDSNQDASMGLRTSESIEGPFPYDGVQKGGDARYALSIRQYGYIVLNFASRLVGAVDASHPTGYVLYQRLIQLASARPVATMHRR